VNGGETPGKKLAKQTQIKLLVPIILYMDGISLDVHRKNALYSPAMSLSPKPEESL